ncbi:MAG: hypothetical protein WAT76_03015, partial [Dokdonella sp.]
MTDLAADPRLPGKRHLRQSAMRGFALVAFVAMLAGVPLAEKLPIEKAFALAIVGSLTLVLLFATARLAFSLLVASLLFGALATASMLKLEFLMTPALAPDLKYYFNWQTIEVIYRYPVLI